MVVNQDRRLEVVVLAARGLPAEHSGRRRKVQLSLTCAEDPHGQDFPVKVSPWTDAATSSNSVVGQHQQQLFFGRSGLRCNFLLSGSRGAPAVASGARFPETAKLQIRLLVSAVASKNSVLSAASAFLPTSITDGVKAELDEATAEVEAETSIPLTNVISGRSAGSFAADRALGGWVPLRKASTGSTTLAPPLEDDSEPLGIWMQLYALPDHAEMLPKLQEQLEIAFPQQQQRLQTADAQRTSMAASRGAQAVNTAPSSQGPRWGPGGYNSAPATVAAPATVTDLIDISLDDAAPAEATIGIASTSSAQASIDGNRNHSGGFDLMSGQDPMPVMSQDLLLPSFGSEPLQSGSKSSAFGFVAAGSPGAQLDLAALYSNPGTVPTQASRAPANYGALHELDMKKPISITEPVSAAKPGGGESLQSLEQSLVSGLTQSLKF